MTWQHGRPIPIFRRSSPMIVPSSAASRPNAICVSLNFHVFIASSVHWRTNPEREFPAQDGPEDGQPVTRLQCR